MENQKSGIFELSRAEIGTEEMIPVTDTVLENVVIMKNNPNFVKEVEKPRKKTSL